MPPKKSKKGSKKAEAEAKKEEAKASEEEEAPAEEDTKKEAAAKEDGDKKAEDKDDDGKEAEAKEVEKDDKKKKKAGKKKAEDDDEKEETKDEEEKEKEEDKNEEADAGEDDEKKLKKRGRTKEEKPAPAPSGREKRARKSAVAYTPEDFSQTDNSPHFIDGKGTTLNDLDAVKESIESYKDNAEELATAHRFLYATRGRINAKEVKPALLRFNGYLAKPAEGAEKADIEKAEKVQEKKYSTKAYKLTVPILKKLCDVFALDRTKVQDKDTLIEILLDFLGAPSAEPLKGSKKEKEGSKKKKAKKDSGSIDDYEEIVEGEMPTDKQLRQWVRAYVRCFNTSKKSLKDAMEIAEEKFGVSLKEKKDKIKEILTEEM